MAELTIDQALQRGIEAHRAGQVKAADRFYTAILKAQPKHPDANHNMGVLAVGVGKVHEALPFFKTALDANPDTAQFWLSYIDALIRLDRIADAKAVYDQAKSKGANGDSFDQLEKRLNEANGVHSLGNTLIETQQTIQSSTLDIAIQLREIGEINQAIDLLNDEINLFPEDVEMLVLLSHCHLLEDQVEEAKLYLEKAKKIDPQNASVGWNTSRLMLREQKPIEALNVAQDTSQKFPDDVEGMGVFGACLRVNNQIVKSLDILNRAIDLNPNYAEALINRGLIRLNQESKPEALADLELAHRLKPHIKQIWDLVIGLKVEAREYSEAIVLLIKMIETENENEKRWATLAMCYHHTKDFNSALDAYSKALAIKPDYADAYNNMGNVLQDQGKLEEAIEAYKNALCIKPENAQAYYNMGNALKEQGKLEEAIDAYNKTLAIKPDYAEAYNNMGITLKEKGNLEEALDAYNKALAIKPDYAEAYNNMGITLKEKGKLEEALDAYNKALAIKPENAQAYYNLGNVLQEKGKLEEALDAYNKALAIKPDYAEAYYNLGITLKEKGKLEEAIDAYIKALAIKPDYAEAYYNLGNARKEQGKLEEALDAYNKALAIKPDYAEAYNNMGITLQEKGKLEEALDAYNKALAIKPDYAEAYNNIGITLQEKGKLEEALDAYNKALAIEPGFTETHRHLSGLKRYKPKDFQISKVDELLKRPDLKDADRCNLHYTLAKINEDLGHFEIAYENYVAGGALRRKILAYAPEQDQRLFAKIKEIAPNLKYFPLDTPSVELPHVPIFILGMLRSGTTLVEQIISCHTKIKGAGELPFLSRYGAPITTGLETVTSSSLLDFRRNYLDELGKISDGKQFVTDKMPHNFQCIGIILKMLPEAKVIHVKRDPAATCWSNFKHYFAAKGLGYSYDLNDTVRYFKLYQDLLNFWEQLYGNHIYHLDYDKLTVEQESETRKLIEHLELNWEDACLSPQLNNRSVRTASQQQVRKKVYKGSSQAWLKFEPYLKEIFQEFDL